MKKSILGIVFVLLFLVITIGESIILQFSFGDKQWMWGIIHGGSPWSWISLVERSKTLGNIYIYGGYLLNIFMIYLLGYWIEVLCKKFSR